MSITPLHRCTALAKLLGALMLLRLISVGFDWSRKARLAGCGSAARGAPS